MNEAPKSENENRYLGRVGQRYASLRIRHEISKTAILRLRNVEPLSDTNLHPADQSQSLVVESVPGETKRY